MVNSIAVASMKQKISHVMTEIQRFVSMLSVVSDKYAFDDATTQTTPKYSFDVTIFYPHISNIQQVQFCKPKKIAVVL